MLMKANKDPKIQIKETDQDSYHVEFKRITGTLFNPETKYDIQIYSRKDFALLKKAVADQGIYITSYQDMRVVHDPAPAEREAEETRIKEEKLEEERQKIAGKKKEKAEAEMKKKAEMKKQKEAKELEKAEAEASAKALQDLAEKKKAKAETAAYEKVKLESEAKEKVRTEKDSS